MLEHILFLIPFLATRLSCHLAQSLLSRRLSTIDTLQQALIYIPTLERIRRALWRSDLDILQLDVIAHTRRAANHIPADRIILLARRSMNPTDINPRNGKIARELIAQSQILLSVALSNFDSVVDVFDVHVLVSDIVDAAEATATLEIYGEC